MISKSKAIVKLKKQQQRRAKFDALVASLHVPQHTSIVTAPATKARPGVGAFASI